MKFELIIHELEGEAFTEHPESRMLETARILRDCAKRMESGTPYGVLFDVNGNSVGTFTFK